MLGEFIYKRSEDDYFQLLQDVEKTVFQIEELRIGDMKR